MADFNQAIIWLQEGKGIKRTNWRIDGDVHLVLKNEQIFDCYGKLYRFEYDDIITNSWVIYKIRKKKGEVKNE